MAPYYHPNAVELRIAGKKIVNAPWGAPKMEQHHCHAVDCRVATKPEMLMCRRHWSMVPTRLQREVYRTYRPGQCDDKQISGAWLIAAENAIATVAVKEGRLSKAQADAYVKRAEADAKLLDER